MEKLYRDKIRIYFTIGIFVIGFFSCGEEVKVNIGCCQYVDEIDLIYNKKTKVFIFLDYARGLKCAKELAKPILLIFTSHLLPYDEFQYDLINKSRIRKTLNQEYVVIKLFVDDKRKLDSLNLNVYNKIKFTEESLNRINKQKTIGSVNISIQIDNFNSNTQPQYILMNENQELLIEPFGYTSKNETLFYKNIIDGIEKYKNRN